MAIEAPAVIGPSDGVSVLWGQIREAGMIPHYSISEETKEVGLEAGLFFYLS